MATRRTASRRCEAAEQVEAVRLDGDGIEEIVGDKGYHSNQSLVDLEAVGVRRYISEPDRGRRNWKKNLKARAARIAAVARAPSGCGRALGNDLMRTESGARLRPCLSMHELSFG